MKRYLLSGLTGLKAIIYARRLSYRRIFLVDGKINPAAEPALADLKRFCCAYTPTVRVNQKSGGIDPYAMAVAEGRREVWNRIMSHLNVSDDDLFNLREDKAYDE